MNASERLWRQWSGQLRAFLPEIHGHRSKTLAFCVLGVVLAGSTRLPKVAETLSGISAAKTPSIERRLSRFLANQQVAVLPLWSHLLGQFLRFWRDRRLVFVLDATALDERATVLYLGLLVHSRLLPVSWQVLPVHEKWEQRQWEVVGLLLDRIIPHLRAAECTLLADRGLVGHPLVASFTAASPVVLLPGSILSRNGMGSSRLSPCLSIKVNGYRRNTAARPWFRR